MDSYNRTLIFLREMLLIFIKKGDMSILIFKSKDKLFRQFENAE